MTADAARAPAPPPAARTIALLSAAAFGSAAAMRCTDSLLPGIARDFGATLGAASLVVTAFALSYGLLQVVYGPLGDRHGKVRVVALGAGLAALGCLVCAAAPTLPALVAARALAGAAAAAIIPLAMAWIGDAVPYERRQPVLARFLSGQILGLVFGQAAGGAVAEHLGWRAMFVLLALALAAASLALGREGRREARREALRGPPAPPPGPRAPLLPSLRAAAGTRWSRVVLLGVFVEGACVFGAFPFVGSALHLRHGLDLSAVGAVLTLYALGGLAYALRAGSFVRVFGEAGLARAGGALLAACFVALALSRSLWVEAPAVLLSGLGFYMIHNTFQTNATQMAPAARGAAVALFASSFFLGQSLGVALAAPVVDRHGVEPVLLAGGLGAGLVGLWFGHRIARERAAPAP